MASATARAPKPKMRKAGAPTPTLANFINSNDHEYNLQEQRAQRLVAKLGLTVSRARIVSSLAWEIEHA